MDDTLQKIRYKKVRQKLRYLQTELEETKIIYKKCLDKFNTDFAKYLFGEEGVLTVSGEKSHGFFDETKAKVLRRELKHSSFKRQFTLGDMLDGDNISANFKDGILSIEIPKIEPALPKKNIVKIK